jgi:hypothetical protein
LTPHLILKEIEVFLLREYLLTFAPTQRVNITNGYAWKVLAAGDRSLRIIVAARGREGGGR